MDEGRGANEVSAEGFGGAVRSRWWCCAEPLVIVPRATSGSERADD
ncbi:hypothetical protein [Halococcus hamelinensis]|nr:hypothetical protein [Halococcus hamelinensis]